MEAGTVPSKLPPPDHWWSPLEYAPASASEKDGSASEKDDEWNVESDEEFDADQDDDTGSGADTASIELDLSRENFHKSKSGAGRAPGVSAVVSTKKSEVDAQDAEYDKIQNFMMILKSRLDEDKVGHGQDASKPVKTSDTEDMNHQAGEHIEPKDIPDQELVSPSKNVPDQNLAQSPDFQETVRSAEYQLEQLLSTFQGLRERMVTMLDEEEGTHVNSSSCSSSKVHFSDDDGPSLENPPVVDQSKQLPATSLENPPVVDLSKQLPEKFDSQDQGLGASTPWSESSIADRSITNESVSNTQNNSVSLSYGQNFEVGIEDEDEDEDVEDDEDEDELPSMSPWRAVKGNAQPQSQTKSQTQTQIEEFDLSRIRTQPSSEGSDYSAASLSHQIDGAKLTDFDDPDSLFEDEDFDSEPDPYEPDDAPMIHNLTRLTFPDSRRSSAQFETSTSHSQSRFRHLMDANPLYNTAPSAAHNFNQPTFGAPWSHVTHQQQRWGPYSRSSSISTSSHQSEHPMIPEQTYGVPISRDAMHSQNGHFASGAAASQTEHRVRLEYAPLLPGTHMGWGAQKATNNDSKGTGSFGGHSFLSSLAQLGPSTTSGSHAASMHTTSAAYLAPSRASSHGLYSSGMQGGHMAMEGQPPSFQAAPLQQPQSLPPSVFSQMQRERMQGGTRQTHTAAPEVDASPSLSLYSTGPGLGPHSHTPLSGLYSSSNAGPSPGPPSLYSSLPLYRDTGFSPRKGYNGAPIEDIM